ncbi:MAG: DNA repair protein RadC [Patescibacteria group bacterium]|nr:DNA repair protein RadC [Patescibacteria group bacterium]
MEPFVNVHVPYYQYRPRELVLDDVGREYSSILKIHDLPPEEKPREKLVKHGPSVLSVGELLAVVLGVGSRKEGVLAMSHRLLKDYGEKAIMHEKDPKKIAEALDIPLIKACQIVACLELGRRFFRSTAIGRPESLRTARQVYEYLRDMQSLPKEHLRGLYLDSHFRLIHDEVISIGSVSGNLVHPREVFRPALAVSAVAVILAHNHPSGVAKASAADIDVTKQLIEAGRVLGITVLDHVIVTRRGFACVPADYS